MDQVVYRASALGGCLKSMVAGRLGYPQLDQSKVKTSAGVELQELYDEGTRLEEVAVRRLEGEHDWRIGFRQIELNLAVTDKVIIQGHIDGMRIQNGPIHEPALIEIKSMRPASFESVLTHGWDAPGLLQKYKWQLSSYILGARNHFDDQQLGGVLVVIDSNPDVLDSDRRIFQLYTPHPHYSIAELRERVLTAESWVLRGDLPVACDVRSWPCGVSYLHEDEEILQIEDEVIDQTAIELKTVQREIKVLESREKEARKILVNLRDSQSDTAKTSKKKVLDSGEEIVLESVKVKTDKTKLTWYEQMNPPKFSKEKAEEDGVDLGKYKVQDKSWRLRVEVDDGD